MIYTKAERGEQIKAMRKVALAFYPQAANTHVHAFIEFCGLMQKFIDICEQTSKKGLDFNESNTHTGEALAVAAHDVRYLAEKFDCIFGPTLADPKMRQVFLEAMGWV